MRKEILATLISVFVIHCVHAQKSFDVTIKLDPQMNARKVHCYYFDGIGDLYAPSRHLRRYLPDPLDQLIQILQAGIHMRGDAHAADVFPDDPYGVYLVVPEKGVV